MFQTLIRQGLRYRVIEQRDNEEKKASTMADVTERMQILLGYWYLKANGGNVEAYQTWIDARTSAWEAFIVAVSTEDLYVLRQSGMFDSEDETVTVSNLVEKLMEKHV